MRGKVEPLGVANAATIGEALRTAGYELVKQTVPDRYAEELAKNPRAKQAPKAGHGSIVGGEAPATDTTPTPPAKIVEPFDIRSIPKTPPAASRTSDHWES